MDAVAGGSCAKAFVMLDEMIQKREPESKIFYMLSRQAGRLHQLKRMGQGLPLDRKADRLGMNSYALSKMEKLAGRLSVTSLNRFVQGCADMDLAVKSGRIKIRLALELLISGLAEQDPGRVPERRNESSNEH
jgi:DNA polymerase-3 subunit delta